MKTINAFRALESPNTKLLQYVVCHELSDGMIENGKLEFVDDPAILRRLRAAFIEVYDVFCETIDQSGLCLLACYKNRKDKEDAFCRRLADPYNPDGFASGIFVSLDAINNYEREKLLLVLLHELCHSLYQEKVTGDPHSEDFQNLLDAMIAIFNDETGERLQNDYAGMPKTA